jgi:hypothetical protein
MRPDALDTLARQLAAAPASRRVTLQAAGISLAGLLLGLPRRPPGHELPAASSYATPTCSWGNAAPYCAACLLGTAVCAGACAVPVTPPQWAACAACLAGWASACNDCREHLNCHCPPGLSLCGDPTPVGAPVHAVGCCTPDEDGLCLSLCVEGQTCINGQCECPAGETLCNSHCVNKQTDPDNCGGCGKTCSEGYECQGGNCVCPTGWTVCSSGECVNTDTDNNNCGSCGNVCPAGQHCSNGGCCGVGYHYCGTNGVGCCPDCTACGAEASNPCIDICDSSNCLYCGGSPPHCISGCNPPQTCVGGACM